MSGDGLAIAEAVDAPPLWDHQRRFIEFAATSPEVARHGGCLFHGGMRVGKTRSTIELLPRWGALRVLVVAPKKVITSWEVQLVRFGPSGARVVALDEQGTTKDKMEAARDAFATTPRETLLVVVVNYETVWREPLAAWLLNRARFDVLVLDESHRAKDPVGVASRYLTKFGKRVRRRLALTGTPMPHSPLDVFAQLRIIAPGIHGWSWTAFRARYALMGGFEGREVVGYRDLEGLARASAAVTFHVDRSVLKLLPTTHSTVHVRLGRRAWAAYRQMERDLVAEVEQGEITAANGLVKLLRLQQMTGGHAAVDRGDGTTSVTELDDSKREALVELLSQVDAQDRVVVIARFTADIASIRRAAKECGRESFELSGQVDDLRRVRFGQNNPNPLAPPGAVLAMQIQAGSLGIDLTDAPVCVCYSVGFSLGDYEQAIARVHGPDQKRSVGYYHLVAKGPGGEETIDGGVYGALAKRREVVGHVLDMMRGQKGEK